MEHRQSPSEHRVHDVAGCAVRAEEAGHQHVGVDHHSHARVRFDRTSRISALMPELFEEHETKLQALRAALLVGEESGPSVPFDVDRFVREKRTRPLG